MPEGVVRRSTRAVEWPTVGLVIGVHGGWTATLAAAGWLGPLPAAALLAPVVTLHSSLQHEILHGHPTRSQRINEAMASLPLGLLVPYARFRDQHLAHHYDPNLTDPYDDPEANHLDLHVWERLGPVARLVLQANNTLLGRMLLGPVLSTGAFLRSEWRARRERAVRTAWAAHLAGCIVVLGTVAASPMPLWTYLLGCYAGHAILRIRTFAEHRAHACPRARSVVIEDRGPLAFLFLNNNLHALHHAHPKVPWYDLPALYRARRTDVLKRNGGYLYRGYGDILRRHLVRPKDPVVHPFWHRGNRSRPQA